MKINRLSAPTYNRLNMNDIEVSIPSGLKGFEYKEELPRGIERKDIADIKSVLKKDLKTGFGEEFNVFLSEDLSDAGIKVNSYDIKEGEEIKVPLYQTFDYDSNVGNFSLMEYNAGKGSISTVIQFITPGSFGGSDGFIQNRIFVDEEAKFTLVQVQAPGSGGRIFSDIGVDVSKKASFDLIQIVLGGDDSVYGVRSDLRDDAGSISINTAYDLKDKEKLDINYIVDHNGKKTLSDINVNGVLSDSSEKLFRGTIDFHKGCAGSKGNEIESVLLLDEGIINKTIPLILCDEEDVEGSHGASLGRLDDDLVFYFMSRGLNEEEVIKIMSRARIDAVANLIDDNRTKDMIFEILEKTDD